jgi:serpin B
MLYFATTGATHEQLQMSLGLQDVDVGNNLQKYAESQQKLHRGAFENANILFTNKNFKVNDDCGEILKVTFDAKTEPIDFSRDTAANTINNWISAATANKIKDVIKPESLSSKTDIVFISVMNLVCEWEFAFDKGLTETGKFLEEEDIKFMRTGRYLRCLSTDQAETLELPLKSENLRMLFIMPKMTSISKLTDTLCGYSNIKELLDKLAYEDIDLSLPKFDKHFKESLVEPLTCVRLFNNYFKNLI